MSSPVTSQKGPSAAALDQPAAPGSAAPAFNPAAAASPGKPAQAPKPQKAGKPDGGGQKVHLLRADQIKPGDELGAKVLKAAGEGKKAVSISVKQARARGLTTLTQAEIAADRVLVALDTAAHS